MSLYGLKAFILLTIGVCILVGNATAFERRPKRAFWDLYKVVRTYTKTHPFLFNFYGCYCGFGHAGNKPVDAIDKCCKVHDECYHVVRIRCGHPVFLWYKYQCSGGHCRCLDRSSCKKDSCICDVKFALCLKKHEATYNKKFVGLRLSYC